MLEVDDATQSTAHNQDSIKSDSMRRSSIGSQHVHLLDFIEEIKTIHGASDTYDLKLSLMRHEEQVKAVLLQQVEEIGFVLKDQGVVKLPQLEVIKSSPHIVLCMLYLR